MNGYIQTRLYAVITAAGLTPWTGTNSGVPQGGAEGPFLYLLVTLPLAFELARGIPGGRPIPTMVPPHQLRGRQPPNYGHLPPRP